jgi:hypothetical protein
VLGSPENEKGQAEFQNPNLLAKKLNVLSAYKKLLSDSNLLKVSIVFAQVSLVLPVNERHIPYHGMPGYRIVVLIIPKLSSGA